MHVVRLLAGDERAPQAISKFTLAIAIDGSNYKYFNNRAMANINVKK